MPLRLSAYIRAALLALLLLCTLPGAHALATIAPGSSVPAGATGAATPDSSEITNLFEQGWRGGKVSDKARFQSSLIPVANTEWNEIVNYECIYPPGSTRATPGSPVPDEALVDLNNVFKEADGKSGADLRDFLRDKKNASGSAAFADFITVTDDKSRMYEKLAGSGCELNKTVEPDEPGLTELFTSPVGFMQKMMLNIGTLPARTAYNLSAPFALRYAFFTPHAERGETLFSIIGNDNKETSRLGFSKEAIETPEKVDGNPWIRIALWIRWFLAGFFVLITVVIGFMYMLSKSGKRQAELLRTLPRLLLATFLMVVIGPLMGWVISMSNLITRSLFGISSSATATCQGNGSGLGSGGAKDLAAGDCGLLSQINGQIEAFLRADAVVTSGALVPGPAGAAMESFDKLLLGSAILWIAAIFFVMLLIISVARQLILIILVAISPAACFAITFQRTQKWALRWLQAFAVVCLAPAMMSITLYFGLALAWTALSIPIVWFVMMIVTFIAVWKIPLMIKGWFSGQSERSASTSAVNLAGNMAAQYGGPQGQVVAAGLHGVGAAGGMADNAMSSTGARIAAPDFVSSGRRRQSPPRLEAAEKVRETKGKLQELTGGWTSNPYTGNSGEHDARADAAAQAAGAAAGGDVPRSQQSAVGAGGMGGGAHGDDDDDLQITEMSLSPDRWRARKELQDDERKRALAAGKPRPPEKWHYEVESRGGTTKYLAKRNPHYEAELKEAGMEPPARTSTPRTGGPRTVRQAAAAQQREAATSAPPGKPGSTGGTSTRTAGAPPAPAPGTQQTGPVTQVGEAASGALKGGKGGRAGGA